MQRKRESNEPRPPERRRFLRESLTGSVPLLVDWVAGRARAWAQLLQEPRRTSPPPAAADSAPAPAKKDLDERYADFARDNPSGDSLRVNPSGDPLRVNPGSDPYSSPRSFPAESKRGESRDSVQGSERGK